MKLGIPSKKAVLLATLAIIANGNISNAQTVLTTPQGLTFGRSVVAPNGYQNGYSSPYGYGTGYQSSYGTGYYPNSIGIANPNLTTPSTTMYNGIPALQGTNNSTPQYGAPDANGPNGLNRTTANSPFSSQEQSTLGTRRANAGTENNNSNNIPAVQNQNNVSTISPGSRFSGHPEVLDGSTLLLEGQRLTLSGVNVPSLSQTCNAGKVSYWCGQDAKARLQELVDAGTVVCYVSQDNGYGSAMASCSVGFDDLSKAINSTNFGAPNYQAPVKTAFQPRMPETVTNSVEPSTKENKPSTPQPVVQSIPTSPSLNAAPPPSGSN